MTTWVWRMGGQRLWMEGISVWKDGWSLRADGKGQWFPLIPLLENNSVPFDKSTVFSELLENSLNYRWGYYCPLSPILLVSSEGWYYTFWKTLGKCTGKWLNDQVQGQLDWACKWMKFKWIKKMHGMVSGRGHCYFIYIKAGNSIVFHHGKLHYKENRWTYCPFGTYLAALYSKIKTVSCASWPFPWQLCPRWVHGFTSISPEGQST